LGPSGNKKIFYKKKTIRAWGCMLYHANSGRMMKLWLVWPQRIERMATASNNILMAVDNPTVNIDNRREGKRKEQQQLFC